MNKNDICAVLVTYYPENNLIDHIKKIEKQVNKIVIIDNTPDDTVSSHCFLYLKENMKIISNKENYGIAKALNQGIEWAIENNYLWVITFDQDSDIQSNLVSELINIYDSYPCKNSIGMIGANYIQTGSNLVGQQLKSKKNYVAVKEMITSGNLISVEAYQKIGRFVDAFFIDMVDYEFCLRTRKMGYMILLSTNPLMYHSVGNLTQFNFFGKKISLSNHSPLRRYYIFRNSILLLRKAGLFDISWSLNIALNYLPKLFIKACFLEDKKKDNLKWILYGVWDSIVSKYDRKVL